MKKIVIPAFVASMLFVAGSVSAQSVQHSHNATLSQEISTPAAPKEAPTKAAPVKTTAPTKTSTPTKATTTKAAPIKKVSATAISAEPAMKAEPTSAAKK
jgi:hypothetical protein